MSFSDDDDVELHSSVCIYTTQDTHTHVYHALSSISVILTVKGPLPAFSSPSLSHHITMNDTKVIPWYYLGRKVLPQCIMVFLEGLKDRQPVMSHATKTSHTGINSCRIVAIFPFSSCLRSFFPAAKHSLKAARGLGNAISPPVGSGQNTI